MSNLADFPLAIAAPEPEAAPADVLTVLRARRRLATQEQVDEYQLRRERIALQRLQRMSGEQVLLLFLNFPILQRELRR